MNDQPKSEYQLWKAAAFAAIDALPETGATFIVFRNAEGKRLLQGVSELRGKELSKRCRFIQVNSMKDVEKLVGVRGPIMIDLGMFSHAKPDAVAGVRRITEPFLVAA